MNKKDLGLFLLRFGLGGVFLYFGIDKFFNPLVWSNWIPSWLLFTDAILLTYFIGAIEAIVGLFILVGFYARVSALIAGVMLFGIMFILGFNEIMVRDAGLFFMALAIYLLGPGKYSVTFKTKY